MRRSGGITAAVLILGACQGPEPPATLPPGAPSPVTASPAAPSLLAADWSGEPLNEEFAAFTDPSANWQLPWLQAGRWRIAEVRTPAYSGRVWQCQDVQPQPYLSFRVWDGPTTGARYTLKATVQPVSSPHFKPPVGEIALIPYYLDPTHYLEVIVAADHLGIWIADGGTPGTDQGWQALAFMPVRTAVGQLRPLELAVDIDARQLVVRSGTQSWTIETDFLRHRPHGVALRSAGNSFNVTELSLTGG